METPQKTLTLSISYNDNLVSIKMEVMGHGIEWVRFVVSGSVPDAAFLSSAISNTPFISSQKCGVKGDLWIKMNTAWCERSKAALQSRESRFQCVWSAPTARGVSEVHSSQKPQSATVQLSMWKGAPNNAVGKDIICTSFLTPLFTPKQSKCGDYKLDVRANLKSMGRDRSWMGD